MDVLNSNSTAKEWQTALPSERRAYVARVSTKLSDIGMTPPPASQIEERMNRLFADVANVDLDVGRAFTQVVGELTRTTCV